MSGLKRWASLFFKVLSSFNTARLFLGNVMGTPPAGKQPEKLKEIKRMFTGLVEETGRVISLREDREAWTLWLEANAILEGLKIGDSVACNGCCLTVVEIQPGRLKFELLEETLRLTNFHALKENALINLERSLPADGRLGGHFVSGHVDAVGTVRRIEPMGKNVFLQVAVPPEFLRYVVYKGSITVDGISLTVAEVNEDSLSVWLIPHTLEVTNLREKKAGDLVNLEFDLLAKYVEKLLSKNRESIPEA